MPRPKSENEKQIAMRIPARYLTQADSLVTFFASMGLEATRASVLRAAISKGLTAMNEEWTGEKPTATRRKAKRDAVGGIK
jgi:hypothetical protein